MQPIKKTQGLRPYRNNGMMGELVLNQVDGKESLTIKMGYFRPYSQYSSILLFHYDGQSG